MTGTRREGREAALQIIYLADVCGLNFEDIPSAAWSVEPLAANTRDFARRLAEGTLSHQPELDRIVSHYAQNWELKRMAAVDRCVLRLASYELLYERETPVNVIINEAIDIAKLYSTVESGKFVNGILDKVKLERKNG